MKKKMAAGVLCVSGGRFLGIKRFKDGALGIPCGKLEPGESFLSAASREFLEETGGSVKIKPKPLYVAMLNDTEVWIFLADSFSANVPFRTLEGETVFVTEKELSSDNLFGKFNRELVRAYNAQQGDY